MNLRILIEMNEKAQRLVELMKKDIVEFVFQKASTGKERTAHGTLDPDRIPKEARRKQGRPKKRPDYLVIYYDTDRKAIRSFKDFLLKKIVTKKPKEKKKDPKKNDNDK